MRRQISTRARTIDYPAKLICWFLVNINRDREAYPQPLSFDDVFPDHEETDEERSERILAQFRALTALFGGTDTTLES